MTLYTSTQRRISINRSKEQKSEQTRFFNVLDDGSGKLST